MLTFAWVSLVDPVAQAGITADVSTTITWVLTIAIIIMGACLVMAAMSRGR